MIQEDNEFNDDMDEFSSSIVHVRVQQRRGRKCFTNIEGIPAVFDYNKIMKYWKKWLNCNGTIVEEEGQRVIMLNGDHRQQIQQFLREEGIALEDNIRVHGI